MNICGYEAENFVNGEGVRTCLWVSGCPHRCEGCFNRKFWAFDSGNLFTEDDMQALLKDLGRSFITGLTILGGEPLAPENIEGVIGVILRVRAVYGDTKDILVYTGYTFDQIPQRILDLVDMIIDGKYEKDLPTKKPFRGSDNQHYYAKKDGQWVMID